MIISLDGVSEFTQRLAASIPDELEGIRSDIVIVRHNGERDAEKIKTALPHFSSNYLACVSKLELFGAVLGYFSLWPGATGEEGLVAAVLAANRRRRWRFGSSLDPEVLNEVAGYEGNPIFVASNNAKEFDRDEVLMLNHDAPQAPLIRIARNFETLVLLAANLSEVRFEAKHSRLTESPITEFGRRTARFVDSPDQSRLWEDFAAGSLG